MQPDELVPLELSWKSVGVGSCVEGEQSRISIPYLSQFSSMTVPGSQLGREGMDTLIKLFSNLRYFSHQ